MLYAMIISLLIEKPFYLLRPQRFSFQIVSEFTDTFVKFYDIMVGLSIPCFVPKGGLLYTLIVVGGEFCSLPVLSQGFVPMRGMVLDEIDTCIIQ